MRSFAISTGLSGLDKIIDGLRMGDNVVWQVDRIEDYQHFVEPFVNQAALDNRPVIYMRFGRHSEIIEPSSQVKVYHLEPNIGFESFSAQVHAIADDEGPGVYYIFDSLSDLQSAWATDLMIGNFFKVTCPYLYELNTIAYFTILRNTSSYQTIARIRETTQLLLDIYQFNHQFYIQPLKAWNRYSPTMFLPHVGIKNDFIPITSSAETARLFSHFQRYEPGDTERKLDYWDLVFFKAQEMLDKLPPGQPTVSQEIQPMVEQLCKMMIGRDERVLALARHYFSLADLVEIRNRLIGSGYIGGKTVGMLLARKILEADHSTNWGQWMEPHDSFYVGSDVFYTYLVENGCWTLRLKQKLPENYFSVASELKQKILDGSFPPGIREDFYQILEYFGQSPIIVRSSSLLEDSFGNAFAGKYESIFCVNRGTPQERYEFFEQAVKKIYASTMNEDALTYRLQRSLAQKDEQMALLIQRVSGSHNGQFFFPDLAGVALSHNPYVWREDMDPAAGMMRLVFGLGTRAVDRVEDDYPRVVALDKPTLQLDSDPETTRKFSQHQVDLLDTEKNIWRTVPLDTVFNQAPRPRYWHLLAKVDYDITTRRRAAGRQEYDSWILTFENLLADTSFPQLLRKMLSTLQKAYEYPVDTEFTANFLPDGQMQFNLLQCRPLQTSLNRYVKIDLNAITREKILFSCHNTYMGASSRESIKTIIWVQVDEYNALPIADKYQTARLIGKLNQIFNDRTNTSVMLIGPGRWGSSIPSLGVPVSFAEICNVAVLVETDDKKAGYMPELSFGTHFFQDLVETQIFYVALFTGKENVIMQPELLAAAPNVFARLLPEYSKYQSVIKVIDLDMIGRCLWLSSDLKTRQVVCYLD